MSPHELVGLVCVAVALGLAFGPPGLAIYGLALLAIEEYVSLRDRSKRPVPSSPPKGTR